MPWTPSEYRRKHNKKLTLAQAKSASKQAEAMIRSGVDEGIAIATANKRFAGGKKSLSHMMKKKG